jgi:hypothetical protein
VVPFIEFAQEIRSHCSVRHLVITSDHTGRAAL